MHMPNLQKVIIPSDNFVGLIAIIFPSKLDVLLKMKLILENILYRFKNVMLCITT